MEKNIHNIKESKDYECCIIGAGPAGLAAANELIKHGIHSILIIDKNNSVGGLSRTEKRGGARFDLGPHRFYSKNSEVNRLWFETLGNDFLPVDRLTRILYKSKYFYYPIKAFDVLQKMNWIACSQILFSYAVSLIRSKPDPYTFEEWVSQKFGWKLYETFFKTYTEKVWGIPCNEIGAEWAAQRIKGLELVELMKNAMKIHSKTQTKTLVDRFNYPVLGSGQMYETMCEKAQVAGAELMLNTSVAQFNQRGNEITSVDIENEDGRQRIFAKHFFSGVPLTHLFKLLKPSPSHSVLKAVDALYYRDHITVDLIVDADNLFPDQWIYIHSPDVRMARLANYNNFSKAMTNHKKKTALSIEYFVFQNDEFCEKSDTDLIDIAVEELSYLKIVDPKLIENAWVLRETECYPTYYLGYNEHYDILKHNEAKLLNLTQVGRGGMYKYNNQDHSIITGILAARNYLQVDCVSYNLWNVNIDAEYLESANNDNLSKFKGVPPFTPHYE